MACDGVRRGERCNVLHRLRVGAFDSERCNFHYSVVNAAHTGATVSRAWFILSLFCNCQC